jgi:hypothetical protein
MDFLANRPTLWTWAGLWVEAQARLMDAFQRVCRGWTVDQIICHPRDAIRFCDAVREATQCHDLPNALILKFLMGAR